MSLMKRMMCIGLVIAVAMIQGCSYAKITDRSTGAVYYTDQPLTTVGWNDTRFYDAQGKQFVVVKGSLFWSGVDTQSISKEEFLANVNVENGEPSE